MQAAPPDDFEIFLAAAPGLEPALAQEARAAGFALPQPVPGGVVTRGGWPEIWRANLALRGAARVLVRIGEFRAFHLAQLDKRARKFPWEQFLRADIPVSVEAFCRASKIYHGRAAAQRIERAIAEGLGAPIGPGGVAVKLRIDDNLVTISLDASGEPLHRRGHKTAIGKAPLRETLAALFLAECGYDGREPVVDPMCGSGTFVIEAAEIACGLMPGRSRDFAFQLFAGFDADAFARLRGAQAPRDTDLRFHGHDRDDGAIRSAAANAERAGVAAVTHFSRQAISDLVPPEGPKGLVMVNPPYGARIGNKKPLFALYGSLGAVLTQHFSGWRIGIVTSEPALAKATGLRFDAPAAPVAHGPLKVTLWRTGLLP